MWNIGFIFKILQFNFYLFQRTLFSFIYTALPTNFPLFRAALQIIFWHPVQQVYRSRFHIDKLKISSFSTHFSLRGTSKSHKGQNPVNRGYWGRCWITGMHLSAKDWLTAWMLWNGAFSWSIIYELFFHNFGLFFLTLSPSLFTTSK